MTMDNKFFCLAKSFLMTLMDTILSELYRDRTCRKVGTSVDCGTKSLSNNVSAGIVVFLADLTDSLRHLGWVLLFGFLISLLECRV